MRLRLQGERGRYVQRRQICEWSFCLFLAVGDAAHTGSRVSPRARKGVQRGREVAGRAMTQNIAPRVNVDRREREALHHPRHIAEATESSGASMLSARHVVRTKRGRRRVEVHWARVGIGGHASLSFWRGKRATGFGRQCSVRGSTAGAWNPRPGQATRSRMLRRRMRLLMGKELCPRMALCAHKGKCASRRDNIGLSVQGGMTSRRRCITRSTRGDVGKGPKLGRSC